MGQKMHLVFVLFNNVFGLFSTVVFLYLVMCICMQTYTLLLITLAT